MRRVIGIQLNRQQVIVVQVKQQGQTIQLERLTQGPLDIDSLLSEEGRDEVSRSLAQMIEQAGMDTKARVAVNMPASWVYYCSLKTHLTQPDDIKRLLPYELEEEVPIEFDDLNMDLVDLHRVTDQTDCLVAATRRVHVQALQHTLTQAGLNAHRFTTEISALRALVFQQQGRLSPHGPVLVLGVLPDRVVINLFDQGHVCVGRSLTLSEDLDLAINVCLRELDKTRRSWETATSKTVERALVVAAGQQRSVLAEGITRQMGLSVDELSVYEGLTQEQERLHPGQWVALGLALTEVRSRGSVLNFLAADRQAASLKKEVRRSLLLAGGLVCLLIVTLAFYEAQRFKQLKHRNAALDQQIQNLFQQSLPEVGRMVQPVPQMTEKLQQLRRDHGVFTQLRDRRALPLHVLQWISKITDQTSGVTIGSLTLQGRHIEIEGWGTSFAVNEAFLADLRRAPQFVEVKMENEPITQIGGQVKFKVHIDRELSHQ